jgi:hypothetical protein
MMSALPSLDLRTIGYRIVKSAIEAMKRRNKKQWYGLFSDNHTFTDDVNAV